MDITIDIEPVNSIQEEPTFGMKLVGITFNPSNDPKVSKAKELCAELADLVQSSLKNMDRTDIFTTLYYHTIGEILNAQMNVVKFLTLKY